MRDTAVRDVAGFAELHELLPEQDEEHAGVRRVPHVRVRAPSDQGVVVLDGDLIGEERAERAEGPKSEECAGKDKDDAHEEPGGHVEKWMERTWACGAQ